MDFFCKLVAPRTTFFQDLTPEEGQLMQRHGAYLKELMAQGHVTTFGVVGHPDGVFGMAVVTFDSMEQARAATDADPVIQANAGFSYEIYPMPFGAVRR
jgi:uncharacterized protein YciI